MSISFLDVVETVRAEQVSVQKLFGGEGTRVRAVAQSNNAYLGKLAEAAKLIADVYAGKKPAYLLKEAMSTSDFPQLFGDVLDRQLLASYRETPSTWQNYIKRATVRDFRDVKRFTVDGGTSQLEQVAELAGYPAASRSDGGYSYGVKKYGRRMPFSWEALINDDLDALRDIPQVLGSAAKYSEEYFATNLFVGTTGPDGTFYASGNSNVITGNPVLSINGLQTAMTVLSSQTNSDGRPIAIEAMELVVPPALEVTAMNILNGMELRLKENGGSTNTELITANWMKARFRLNVNYVIPLIATASNANTSWFLFARPAAGDRPAAEMGFLRGHEEPEVFMKAPNAQRVGGGVDPMAGDFDSDSFEYKVRHVFGGTTMDPKMSVASNGSGS